MVVLFKGAVYHSLLLSLGVLFVNVKTLKTHIGKKIILVKNEYIPKIFFV